MDYDTMEAGPETDVAVAEKVFGYRIAPALVYVGTEPRPAILVLKRVPCPDRKPGCLVAHHADVPEPVACYSTNIVQSREVIDHLASQGWAGVECGPKLMLAEPFFHSVETKYKHRVLLYPPGEQEPIGAAADTIQLARCRAALKAVSTKPHE